MKKIYMEPEFELISIRLTDDVLNPSIESGQTSTNALDLDDPVTPGDPGEEPISLGI